MVHGPLLKKGGSLFTGRREPEATLVCFDDTEVVFENMGCSS